MYELVVCNDGSGCACDERGGEEKDVRLGTVRGRVFPPGRHQSIGGSDEPSRMSAIPPAEAKPSSTRATGRGFVTLPCLGLPGVRLGQVKSILS